MASLLELLPLLLKLVLVILERTKNTKGEQRRQILAALDSSLDDAKKGDLSNLSIWFGKHL